MYYPTILIRIRSATDPTPHHIRHPKKIRIRNRIRVISAPLHIRQKNTDADVVNVLSDPIRSAFIPTRSGLAWVHRCACRWWVGGRPADGVTRQPRPRGSGDTVGARHGLVANVGGAHLRAANAAPQAAASSVGELHAQGR
jgi:hypothetical protein